VIVLVGGGVRCGKSDFALAMARRLGRRRVFIATAESGDQDMAERIARHARDRGLDFRTVEAPIDVVGSVVAIEDTDVVVLDCLTLWLSNLLLAGRSEAAIVKEVERLILVFAEKPIHAVVVTNEVGMGVVPESALGRAFRDVSGRVHQRFARAADEIFFGALGTMIRLRPAPVALATEGR
jgi:adenosylcobinamide kinase/adenosylcobinamide-phosphate guanylyltransferase